MAVITVTFTCGHQVALSGDEMPVCACGCDKIAHVNAPPPKFRGYVRGPHATYEELPAKPLVLGDKGNG
jgi:hypothetical protein